MTHNDKQLFKKMEELIQFLNNHIDRLSYYQWIKRRDYYEEISDLKRQIAKDAKLYEINDNTN